MENPQDDSWMYQFMCTEPLETELWLTALGYRHPTKGKLLMEGLSDLVARMLPSCPPRTKA